MDMARSEVQKQNLMTHPKTNAIPVVFITDDNYVIPTATAITSLIASKNTETIYEIYVISTCLSKINVDKFNSFNSDKIKINIIQSSLDKYAELHKYKKNSVCVATPSALLKFEIPNFLSKYDKAIYMDGDILVQRDLSDLWNTDIKDIYVAAAYDTGRLYSQNPKFAKYPQYFNSGVMLLNLKMMREENIPEKLYEAKKNSTDMSLMDQNIFNEVLKERIKNIDITFNFLTINLRRAIQKYEFSAINNLFNSDYKSLEDIEEKSYVLHFSSKDKPWKYYNGEYSEMWYQIFMMSPYKDANLNRVWKNSSLLPEQYKNIRDDKELIVSLTSYPARINTVHLTIESILDQTFPADKVILWLAPEQFPNKEADLPDELIDLTKKGLTIDWYHDIRSYKKLIPALKKYPKAYIITADDDILYPSNWIFELYNSYQSDKKTVWCHRSHQVTLNYTGKILPYKKWRHNIKKTVPSYVNFCTSGGGVFYTPKTFYKDIMNEDKFLKIAPAADDIWFWAMCVLNNKKINVVDNNMSSLTLIDGTQEDALWRSNVLENHNDRQLREIIKYYPKLKKALKVYKPNICSAYTMFLYNLLTKRKKKMSLLNQIYNKLCLFRLDIKNNGSPNNNAVVTLNNPYKTYDYRQGKIVECDINTKIVHLKIVKDGNLSLIFRGIDRKFNNERIPLWIDFQSIKINGKEILSKPIQVWHDEFFRYTQPVKDKDQIILEVTASPHVYNRENLRDVVQKMNTHSDYIQEHLDEIASLLHQKIEDGSIKKVSDKWFSFSRPNLYTTQVVLFGKPFNLINRDKKLLVKLDELEQKIAYASGVKK